MVLTPTAIGEFMNAATLRLALVASGAVLAGAGLLAAGPGAGTQTGASAGSIEVPLAPTTSVAPSFAPTDPVDCNDPNNMINCSTPPLDSPLVSGTAEPGSPFRD